MNLDLDTAAAEWIAAKEAEREFVKRRRALEDHMLSLLGMPEDTEGTINTDTDGGHKIKVVGKMSHKVQPDLAQEIAIEHGLEDSLSHLFRWKAEINVAAWKATNSEITERFAKCVTTKPSRASFSIEKE